MDRNHQGEDGESLGRGDSPKNIRQNEVRSNFPSRRMNGATGVSDMAGKVGRVVVERCGSSRDTNNDRSNVFFGLSTSYFLREDIRPHEMIRRYQLSDL